MVWGVPLLGSLDSERCLPVPVQEQQRIKNNDYLQKNPSARGPSLRTAECRDVTHGGIRQRYSSGWMANERWSGKQQIKAGTRRQRPASWRMATSWPHPPQGMLARRPSTDSSSLRRRSTPRSLLGWVRRPSEREPHREPPFSTFLCCWGALQSWPHSPLRRLALGHRLSGQSGRRLRGGGGAWCESPVGGRGREGKGQRNKIARVDRTRFIRWRGCERESSSGVGRIATRIVRLGLRRGGKSRVPWLFVDSPMQATTRGRGKKRSNGSSERHSYASRAPCRQIPWSDPPPRRAAGPSPPPSASQHQQRP